MLVYQRVCNIHIGSYWGMTTKSGDLAQKIDCHRAHGVLVWATMISHQLLQNGILTSSNGVTKIRWVKRQGKPLNRQKRCPTYSCGWAQALEGTNSESSLHSNQAHQDSKLPSGKRLHNELENHHAINGKTDYNWGIFNSYVKLPDGISIKSPLNPIKTH